MASSLAVPTEVGEVELQPRNAVRGPMRTKLRLTFESLDRARLTWVEPGHNYPPPADYERSPIQVEPLAHGRYWYFALVPLSGPHSDPNRATHFFLERYDSQDDTTLFAALPIAIRPNPLEVRPDVRRKVRHAFSAHRGNLAFGAYQMPPGAFATLGLPGDGRFQYEARLPAGALVRGGVSADPNGATHFWVVRRGEFATQLSCVPVEL